MPEDLQGAAPVNGAPPPGGLSDDQAAEGFEKILNPKQAPKAKAAAAPAPEKAKREPVEEGDDNPEEEPDAEEPEEEEEEPEQEPEEDDGESEVTVKIDGKTTKIKLRDLTDGYLRQSDYSRKTQQLAEERKAHEGELASARTERENYRVMLGHLRQQMDSLIPQEPNWEALLQTQGTDAFLRTRIAWDQAQKNRAQIEQQYQALSEQKEAEDQAAFQKALESEHGRMIEAIPEWKDQKVMKKERDQMVEWARRNGFSDSDIDQVTDHRAVHVLRLAWLGDKMLRAKQSIRPAPEPEEIKPARPLSPSVRSQATGLEAAKKRQAQSGSDEDTTALFQMMEQNYQRRRA